MTRVVVLRALGLGDLLTALPALRGLRRGLPAARITLAAPAWLAPLVPLLEAVDELADTAPLAPLAEELSGADLAVNLHGRGPQSTALLAASGPGRLVAYGVTSTWRDDEHEVARWCRLVTEAGLPADPGDLAITPTAVPPVRGAVLVHPGSAAASRRWPLARWAEVAAGLREAGPVLVTAGPGEGARAREVAAAAGLDGDAVVEGLALPELAALVGAARLLLSSDTGVAHLATAVGTPSVVLFGPVSPQQWGPPADRPQHVALWGGTRSPDRDPDPAPALLAVTPEQVRAAALGLLRDTPGR